MTPVAGGGSEAGDGPGAEPSRPPSAASWVMVAVAWAAVSLPLLWGVVNTLKKAALLFR